MAAQIGYLSHAQMLLIAEISLALISCCLPGTFNLLKHAAREYLSGVFRPFRSSRSLEGLGGAHIGAVGVDTSRHRGFLQLHNDRSDIDRSNDRLFDRTSEGQNHTTAYPDRSTGEVNQLGLEEDIALNEIHVRNDFHVV